MEIQPSPSVVTPDAKQNAPMEPSILRQRAAIAGLAAVLVVICVATVWMLRSRWKEPSSLDEIKNLLGHQSWAKTEQQLRRYLAGHQDDPEALLMLGMSLAEQRAFIECAQVLERVPETYSGRAMALAGAGDAWRHASRRREAERVWRACLGLPSTDLELPNIQQYCRQQLCRLYALERRRPDLWEVTWQLYEKGPERERHEPLAMRTRYEIEMVDPPVALAELELALQSDPQDVYSRRAVGLYHLEAGRADDARLYLNECVQQQPENLLVWEAWLQCLNRTVDHFLLAQALRDLPATVDDSADCWKYRAIVAEQQEEWEPALEAAQHARKLQPAEPEHYHRIGQLLVRMGDKTGAQKYLTRSQELQEAQQELQAAFEAYRTNYQPGRPESADLAYRLGQAYERLGLPQEAVAWYRAGASEKPSHTLINSALERMQSEMTGDEDAAPLPE